MPRFILRRLGFVVLTVLLSSMVVFAATNVLPGDVASMVLGREASEEAKQSLREELGLDRPLLVQYGDWLGDMLRGDWGTSLSTGEDVRDITLERLRNSAMLALVAFFMYVPLGIFLGVVAAWRRNSSLDQVISAGSLAFVGLPEFVTAVLVIALFSRTLGWFPSSSSIPPDTSFVDALPSLILPALTVSLTSLAYVVRMTRASTAEVLQTDYVRTARLKGLAPREPPVQPRAQELAPAHGDRGRGRGRLADRRTHSDRVGFRLPGVGASRPLRRTKTRYPPHPGDDHGHRDRLRLANLAADIIYALLNPRIRYR